MPRRKEKKNQCRQMFGCAERRRTPSASPLLSWRMK
jgi:hypothetical protein